MTVMPPEPDDEHLPASSAVGLDVHHDAALRIAGCDPDTGARYEAPITRAEPAAERPAVEAGEAAVADASAQPDAQGVRLWAHSLLDAVENPLAASRRAPTLRPPR
jgi:hypothetical protein